MNDCGDLYSKNRRSEGASSGPGQPDGLRQLVADLQRPPPYGTFTATARAGAYVRGQFSRVTETAGAGLSLTRRRQGNRRRLEARSRRLAELGAHDGGYRVLVRSAAAVRRGIFRPNHHAWSATDAAAAARHPKIAEGRIDRRRQFLETDGHSKRQSLGGFGFGQR